MKQAIMIQVCYKYNKYDSYIVSVYMIYHLLITGYIDLPMDTYGSLSVLPWAWIVNKPGPVMSTPPRTKYAPMLPS